MSVGERSDLIRGPLQPAQGQDKSYPDHIREQQVQQLHPHRGQQEDIHPSSQQLTPDKSGGPPHPSPRLTISIDEVTAGQPERQGEADRQR